MINTDFFGLQFEALCLSDISDHMLDFDTLKREMLKTVITGPAKLMPADKSGGSEPNFNRIFAFMCANICSALQFPMMFSEILALHFDFRSYYR